MEPSGLGNREFFEDFEDDFRYEYEVVGLAPESIIEFASNYDPQRFHLDKDAAARTHFGGLVASGFQTQLSCFKPFCESILVNANAIGAPGIDSLKWLRPWYPQENLQVSVDLTGKRQSSRRIDRGYLNFKLLACVEDLPVISMEWMVIMLTRSAEISVATPANKV